MNTIIKLNNLTNLEIDEILYVWKTSVEETHDFLSEKDIENLVPQVIEGVKGIEELYAVKKDNHIVAFMGLQDSKIEMLFVSSDMRGKGVGKDLILYAIQERKAYLVDVNEQNIQGIGFYKHFDFKQIDRSETDEAGNPFPILHLSLK